MTSAAFSPQQLRQACDVLDTVSDSSVLDDLSGVLAAMAATGGGATVTATFTDELTGDIVASGSVRSRYFTVGVAADVAGDITAAEEAAQAWARDVQGLNEALASADDDVPVDERWQIGIEAW